MAQYATLKAAIDAVIKANGQREITGTVLNQTLNAMVNSLGADYQFAGVATPSTNPGTPDQNVFYLAFEDGTYTNFNATVLSAGISILMWNGSWSSQTFYTIDATPTASSNNLVSSGAVFDAIKTDGSAYDVSAHFPTGGPNSDGKFTLEYILSNADTLIPTAWRKGGMSIRFVSSSDNKYVQYRLTANDWSTDTEDWAIADEGVYVENPEFVYAFLDRSRRLVLAIKNDATVYYGAGVPPQIIAYIQQKIEELSLDKVNDIVDFLGSLIEGDKTLTQLLAGKLDAEGLDAIALSKLYFANNKEWACCTIDNKRKIVQGRRQDGTLVEFCDVEYPNGIPSLIKATINVNSKAITTLGKVSLIGDSIGYFQEYNSWLADVCNCYNGSIEVNASVSGSSASSASIGFYPRVNQIGNPNTIIVELGTNDSARSVAISTNYNYTLDMDQYDESVFIDAYIKGIRGLMMAHPSAAIICLIMNMGEDYATAIKNIANFYGLKVIDCRGYSCIDDYHPNSIGVQHISNVVIENITGNRISILENKLSYKNIFDYSRLVSNEGYWDDAFVQALTDNDSIYIPKGEYNITNPIVIPRDNITILADKGAKIYKDLTKEEITHEDCRVLYAENKNNISVIGGYWDAYTKVSGTLVREHSSRGTLSFFRCSRLTIKDCLVKCFDGSFCIQPGSCNNLTIDNIYFDNASGCGVQVGGNTNTFTISNLSGVTNDDFVALNGYDWWTSSAEIGIIQNGRVYNLYPTLATAAVRINTGSANKDGETYLGFVRNVIIENIYGSFKNVHAVHIGYEPDEYGSNSPLAVTDGIIVRNVYCKETVGTTKPAIHIFGIIGNIELDNIFDSGNGLLLVNGVGTSVEHLTIKNYTPTDDIHSINLGWGNINRLELHAINKASGFSNGLLSVTGGSIENIHARDCDINSGTMLIITNDNPGHANVKKLSIVNCRVDGTKLISNVNNYTTNIFVSNSDITNEVLSDGLFVRKTAVYE